MLTYKTLGQEKYENLVFETLIKFENNIQDSYKVQGVHLILIIRLNHCQLYLN